MANRNYQKFDRPKSSNSAAARVVGILLLLVVIAVGGWVLASRKDSGDLASEKNVDDSSFVIDSNASLDELEDGEVLGEQDAATNENTNTPSDKAATTSTPKDTEAAKSRDEQRLKDVEAIRSALKSYNDKNKQYPEKLEELVPKYLESVPKNPTPGGQEYSYTPIGAKPYGYYDMSYGLEGGAKDVTAGLHIANPDGLAMP